MYVHVFRASSMQKYQYATTIKIQTEDLMCFNTTVPTQKEYIMYQY